MKRMICLLLASALLLGTVPCVCATEPTESMTPEPIYGVLPVCRVDFPEDVARIPVMYLDGFVYAQIDVIAGYLDYEGGAHDDFATLFNTDDDNLAKDYFNFYFDSTSVTRSFFQHIIEDEHYAPCKTVKNDQGVWIPLDYTVALVGGELQLVDGKAVITPPGAGLTWVLERVMADPDRYSFNWVEDFELTDDQISDMANAAQLVEQFNGVLQMDGTAWKALFLRWYNPVSMPYDEAYGEELAVLMCTSSGEEFQASAEYLANLSELTEKDGTVVRAIQAMEDTAKTDYEALMARYIGELEAVIQDTNTPQVRNSRTAKHTINAFQGMQAFKDAETYTRQFSKLTNTLSKIVEAGGYFYEFSRQDAFAVDAFAQYLEETENKVQMSHEMLVGMENYVADLHDGLTKFTTTRLIEHGIEDLAAGTVTTFLGGPAALSLLGWSLANNAVPWLEEGIDSTHQFQLSLYGMILESDAYLHYVNRKQEFGKRSISPEEVDAIVRDLYVYLKSCYVARASAVACLSEGMTEEEIAAVFTEETIINGEIATYLAILRQIHADGATYYRGFWPIDNRAYLQTCDDTNLAKLIQLEPYASYLEKIEELERDHGEAHLIQMTSIGVKGLVIIGGVSFVSLKDFDQDGITELVVAYKENNNANELGWIVEVYGYDMDTQTIVRHFRDRNLQSGFGEDSIAFTAYDGKKYLISGFDRGELGSEYSYHTLVDGQMHAVRHVDYYDYFEDGDSMFLVNGKQIGRNLFYAQEEEWQHECESYYFLQDMYQFLGSRTFVTTPELVAANKNTILKKASLDIG